MRLALTQQFLKLFYIKYLYLSQATEFPIKLYVHPLKTQNRQRIHAV